MRIAACGHTGVTDTAVDAQVRRAIETDDAPALLRVTGGFSVWKRKYMRTLITARAHTCMKAFMGSAHRDLTILPLYVARHSKDWRLLHAAVSHDAVKTRAPDRLLDILAARSDLSHYEHECMRRAVVGMFYVN